SGPDPRLLTDPLEELAAVVRLADRRGRDGADLVHTARRRQAAVALEDADRLPHRRLRDVAPCEGRAEPDHVLDAVHDLEGSGARHVHDDHVERVAAEVHRGDPHRKILWKWRFIPRERRSRRPRVPDNVNIYGYPNEAPLGASPQRTGE